MSDSLPAQEVGTVPGFALLRPLQERNFSLLWFGSLLSYLGAQLTLIAFPWLVLKLTGDALAMGTVLAVASVPRAVFMIFGGALTDRYSARAVMLWVNWLRMFLMFILAALVYTQAIEMWMIYLIGFLFGVIDAFYWPASSAILPRILPPELLPAGNSLVQGIGQLSLMLGPVLAGTIITMFATDEPSDLADLPGIAFVFAIDGVGFIVSIIALSMIRLVPLATQTGPAEAPESFSRSIVAGFKATWQDVPVRLITVVFTIFSLFFRGPYLVGVPMLCDVRFEEGALAFGMISSAFGVGALIGLVLAGTLARPPEKYLGMLVLADIAVLGGVQLVYAFTPHVEFAMLASSIGGIADGYMMVLLISWLQTRIPGHLLGRVMGMIMFFNQGVAPISAAAAGALIRFSLEGVLFGSGAILMTLAFLGMLVPTIRWMGLKDELVRA